MTHPLTQNLSKLSDQELSRKMAELNKKLGQASRTNYMLANQIMMVIEDYHFEYNRRLMEQDKKLLEELGDDFFSDKIDIE